jgi:hypothetical protein
MRAIVLLLLLLTVMPAMGGCASECKAIRAEFEQLELSQVNKVQTTKMFKPDAPEVLGVSVRASVFERLVSSVVLGKATPMTTTVKLGPGKLVAKVRLLDLTLLPFGECKDCLRFSAAVKLDVQVVAGPLSLASTEGRGQVVARVPMVLEASREGSTLSADLGRATVEDVRVEVGELPSAARGPLDKIVTGGVRQALSTMGRRVRLVRWDPVKLEGSTVRLVASKLVLFPEDQVVWVGFKSNLSDPASPVVPRVELGEGEDLSATFSGTLMSAVLRSMMANGKISDRFNDDLKPDPKGDFRVRIASVSPTKDGLQTDFTVWRLPKEDGSCYVVVSEGLATALPHPTKSDKLKIKIRDIEVVDTHGDDMLLDVGLWAKSVFMEETLEAQTSILSAERIELGTLGEVEMKVARVAHDSESISVFSTLSFEQGSKR